MTRAGLIVNPKAGKGSGKGLALARELAGFQGQRYVYLMANFPFYNLGQDFAWLAGEPPGRRVMSLTEALPSRDDTPLDLAYAVCGPYDVEAVTAAVQAWYPGARVQSLQSPYGRYTCRLLLVDGEDAAGRRGVTVRLTSSEGNPASRTLQAPTFSLDWDAGQIPLPPPFDVQWDGALYIPAYGSYALRIEGGAPADLWVDGRPANNTSVLLAEGWHPLRAAGRVERLPASASLWWRRDGGDWEPVPAVHLDASPEVPGLLAAFFACDGEPSGDPVWLRVEPLIALQTVPSEWEGAPVKALAGRSYCAVYEGWLWAAPAGRYGVRLVVQSGEAHLLLDGRPVIEDAGRPWEKIAAEAEVELTQGAHALRLEYRQREGEFSGVGLYWRPPAGQWSPVPPAALSRFPGEGMEP